MEYIDENWDRKTPVVIHRAIFGSFERFIWIITEQYAGAFPFWLAPLQLSLLPVAEVHEEYAETLNDKWQKKYHTEILSSVDSLWKRIRNAEKQHVPYMLVIGDNEVKNKTVTVRSYADKSQVEMSIEDFEKIMEQLVKEKK